MKKRLTFSIITTSLLGILIGLSSCSKEEIRNDELQKKEILQKDDPADPANEFSGIITPENELIEFSKQKYNEYSNLKKQLKYGWTAHKNFTYICAKKLGLSDLRAEIMRDASVMPDVYQVGIDNAYNQQWSHAIILTETWWGVQWLWGDADDDFHDNLDGDSGESESPEGYNGKWAGYYYDQNNQDLGDWYLGYACHFIEDVSFVLHTSLPNSAMALRHGDFEDWMDNNWSAGHMFSQVAESINVSEYYSFTNPKKAINQAAQASNWYFSVHGKKAWENYEECGYPLEAGTGNDDLVNYTKLMIAEATKWTGATIKYGLDKYNQW